MDTKSHYVVATCIVKKDGKYLIAKRSDKEKVFPGLWTVPGGRIETTDYTHLPKTTTQHWYDVIHRSLRREVKEETGLEIDNVEFVCDLFFIRPDGIPTAVLSYAADFAGGELSASDELVEFAWISLDEAKKFELIEGIYEELEAVDKKSKIKLN